MQQQSVQGWKARTAIHSFTDADPSADMPTSLPTSLCYSCHTALTSKSGRSSKIKRPNADSSSSTASAPASAVNLPTWAAAQVVESRIGDEHPTTMANEIWETQRLDSDLMKSRIGEFILD